MLIKEDRRNILMKHGVPAGFLDAIDNPGKYEDLEFIVKYPDGVYFYLEDIFKDYKILKDYNIIPIYEGGNGDTFWVLLKRDDEARFIHFELENDEIYDDYVQNFNLLFIDFLINYYEFADELSIERLIQHGLDMGFKKSKELFESLAIADEKGLRKTSQLDNQWRASNVDRFL